MTETVDKGKVRALAENIHNLMDLHKRQKDNYVKLFAMCIHHLEDRRRFIPEETWAERKALVEALKEITNVDQN